MSITFLASILSKGTKSRLTCLTIPAVAAATWGCPVLGTQARHVCEALRLPCFMKHFENFETFKYFENLNFENLNIIPIVTQQGSAQPKLGQARPGATVLHCLEMPAEQKMEDT